MLVAITAVLCDERHPLCPDQEETERALIFPHESDLTKFYICATNGTLTEFQCVEGLEFDPEVNVSRAVDSVKEEFFLTFFFRLARFAIGQL